MRLDLVRICQISISYLASDYISNYIDKDDKIIALAYRNIDVNKLNNHIREG
ncbi:MAG UNVERIFIED_CONTAM: hypothetical protein LVQ98_03550 [Rickettsiaceae bacterium]